MSNATGYEIGWDAPIENDSPEFVTLPEGDYDFAVTNFERGRHNGSEKLPPCNKAIVHIRVEGAQGVSTIKHQLFLHSSTEGLLCAFFTAIGQRKRGEKITMNWNQVTGSKGRCKVGIRRWKSDDGRDFESNEIKRFYEPEEKAATAAAPSAPVGFEPGRF